MSIDIWWQGLPDNPPTEAKVCVRSDANGTVGLTVNGTRFTAAALTATDDGNVSITATGLSPNRRYSFSLDFDGTPAFTSTDEKLRTFDTSSSYKVGYGSCVSVNEIMWYGYYAAENCDAFVFMGDAPYLDTAAGTYRGETLVDISDDQTISNIYAFYRAFHKTPGVEYLGHRMPVLKMWDDHELSGDNWDHTVAQANSGSGAANPNLTLQSEVDAIFATCQSAFEAYSKGNPSNADSPTNEAPFMADAAASAYHAKYYRFTIGNTEYFIVDCITHRGPVAAATRTAETLADADARMLGDNQRAWLTTKLAASTATSKVVASGKKTYENTTDNGDIWDAIGSGTTWPGFVTERELLLDYIEANIVGCSFIAGDRHSFSLINQSSARGEARDHVCVVACPLGENQVNSQGAGFNDNVVAIGEYSNMGICEGKSDRMSYSVVRTGGYVVWNGDVLSTDNKLYYEPVSMGI